MGALPLHVLGGDVCQPLSGADSAPPAQKFAGRQRNETHRFLLLEGSRFDSPPPTQHSDLLSNTQVPPTLCIVSRPLEAGLLFLLFGLSDTQCFFCALFLNSGAFSCFFALF